MSRANAASEQSIGSLCEFSSGHGFGPNDWSDKGLPIIRIQNLNGGGKYNYYAGEVDPRWLVKPGDLLFAWAGTKGVSFGPTIWRGRAGVLNQYIYRVHPRAGIDTQWLYAALVLVTREIERRSHGFKSTLVHVHKRDITERKVFAPLLSVQRRVAQIINSWEDSILTTERLVAAKQRRLAAATTQAMLSVARRGPISSVAKQTSNTAGVDYRNFTVFSCTKHNGLVRSDEYFDRQTYGADRTSYKVVAPNEFAYATNHLEEGSIGLNTSKEAGVVSPMYTTFAALSVSQEFLYRVLKTETLRREYERRTPASVNRRGGLRWSDFSSIEIPLPGREEQDRINGVLRKLEKDASDSSELLEALRTQQSGLIRRLLTGEWRVPDAASHVMPTEATA